MSSIDESHFGAKTGHVFPIKKPQTGTDTLIFSPEAESQLLMDTGLMVNSYAVQRGCTLLRKRVWSRESRRPPLPAGTSHDARIQARRRRFGQSVLARGVKPGVMDKYRSR